jgi:hypothetical protein
MDGIPIKADIGGAGMTHVCAWCNPEPGDAETTHGICEPHFIIQHNRTNRRFWLLREWNREKHAYEYFILDRMIGSKLPYTNLNDAADKAFALETRWMEAA